MQNNISKITEIKSLLFTQSIDEAWFINASKLLNRSVKTLKKSNWDISNWNKKWGEIERISESNLIFKRLDKGPEITIIGDENINIALTRLALIGRLIEEMKKENKETYAKVGETDNWNKCVVYANGEKLEEIISADAIFNIYEVLIRDKNRKPIPTPDKKSFQTQTITGKVVTIIKEKEPLTFF